ncbi:hypothetical protein NNL21_35110 [Paenibacillus mendelii]|nr:hypothetical protein [Paenibacillus mendelii]
MYMQDPGGYGENEIELRQFFGMLNRCEIQKRAMEADLRDQIDMLKKDKVFFLESVDFIISHSLSS